MKFAALLLALNLGQASPSYDGVIYVSEYPNGDKPSGGTCPPATWTGLNLGDGGGTICDNGSGDLSFSVTGTNSIDNARIIHKDAGAGEVQIEGHITASFGGSTEANAAIGLGLRESTNTGSWVAQCKSLQTSSTSIQCQYGLTGSTTNVNCQASGATRPEWAAVTYYPTNNRFKGHTSADGSTWTECFSVDYTPSDVIAFFIGGSKSTTISLTATMEDFALLTEIDAYDEVPDGGGNPPVLVNPIPDQNAAQTVPYTFNFTSYFTGATSHTVSGLPAAGGLSESSDGVISGTPDSDDAAASPFQVTMCGVNGDGSTCDIAQFSVAAVPGDTFTISSSATPANYVFDCATTTNCGPGDVILIGSGTHVNRTINFKNLIGTAGSPITIRNDTTAGSRATIRLPSGRPRFGFQCDNCENVIITGLGGWSGQPAGECGVVDSPNGTQDGGEDAVDEHLTGCGILFDGLTNGIAQDMVFLDGTKKNITIEGLEFSGDWSGPGDGAFVEGHGVSLNGKSVCLADAPNEYIENITVRKNYLHNIHDTSMYLGSNYKATCDGLEDNTLPLRDIIVEYNVWDTIGEGGAKIKRVLSSDPTDAIIRYNHGRNGGGSDAPQSSGHNSILFQCFEASCTVYGNVLDTTVTDGKTGPGLSCAIQHRPVADGTQVCHFYNNTIRNTSNYGVSGSRADSGSYGTTAQIEMRVEYNTIVDAARDTGNCVNVGSAITGAGFVRDMICAGAVTSISAGSSIVQSANQQGTVAAQNFVNSGAKNFRLTSSSPARNTGGVGGCPADDADKETRPKGGTCDRGADEFTE